MSNQREKQALILAAGKGTRMKSDLPKVLHELNGIPLLKHVLLKGIEAGLRNFTVVVGYLKDDVKTTVQKWLAEPSFQGVSVSFADQDSQKGTGHAVMMAEPVMPTGNCDIIVLLGDVPLIRSQTIREALEEQSSQGAHAIVLTMDLPEPRGYGRILRDGSGMIAAIREEKDATDAERLVKEVNSGIFVFRAEELWPALKELTADNAQGEYYLTDTVAVLRRKGGKVLARKSGNPDEFRGINSVEQLKEAEAIRL